MKIVSKKKILVAFVIVFFLAILNYLFYLGRVSLAKEQMAKNEEKVAALLRDQNHSVTTAPYAVVDIRSVDDLKNNRDFFAGAKENDQVYYFKIQETGENLVALYRPETESVIDIKKEK